LEYLFGWVKEDTLGIDKRASCIQVEENSLRDSPLRLLDGVEDDGQHKTDGVAGRQSHDSLGGNVGSLTDNDHLIRVELENLGHLGDQERLGGLTEDNGEGAKSEKSALTVGDGLLVLKQRGEALDDGDGLDETLGLGKSGKGVSGDLALLGGLGLDDGINKRGGHCEGDVDGVNDGEKGVANEWNGLGRRR